MYSRTQLLTRLLVLQKEMPEDNSLVTNGHSNLAVKPSGQPGIAELESSVDGNRIQALLDLLRDVDPRYHNLSDDATIQTLYTACVAMKPKLAQLVVETGQRKGNCLFFFFFFQYLNFLFLCR